MELEAMKTQWAAMSAALEKQQALTDSLVAQMMQAKYRNKVRGLQWAEGIGSMVCLLGAGYILSNFRHLDTGWLIGCGIVSCLILVILPVISLRWIYDLRSADPARTDYKQALIAYSRSKRTFGILQRSSYYLGALLLVTSLPVIGRMLSGKDPFKNSAIWIFYAVLFLFFLPVVRWVNRKYVKATNSAGRILEELND